MIRSVDSDNNQRGTHMSIELSIQDHAAAIRELAAAIRGAASSNLATAPATVGARGYTSNPPAEDTIEQDVAKVETDAKAKQQAAMAAVEADRKPANQTRAAIETALAEARKAKEAPAPAAVEEDDPLADSAPLDYEKDVKPLLIKVGKDKTALVALLEKFGAKKGDQIAAADYAAVVAAANAIIGG
jgi:hypothetical protein